MAEASDTISRANRTVDALIFLADQVDADYSADCLDAGNTNRDPRTDAEGLVRHLHQVALEINASGLCDSGSFERFVNYRNA